MLPTHGPSWPHSLSGASAPAAMHELWSGANRSADLAQVGRVQNGRMLVGEYRNHQLISSSPPQHPISYVKPNANAKCYGAGGEGGIGLSKKISGLL